MNKGKMTEIIYAFFFTGIASMAMLSSVCDAFTFTYKAGIFYPIFLLYLMILILFLYRRRNRRRIIIGMTVCGEMVLFLSGKVGESLQSMEETMEAQIKSYFLEGRYAAIMEEVDETWGLLFLVLLFTSVSAFFIICCKRVWCISGWMGTAFLLPFLTGVTPKRHTFFLILLVFFGVVLGKSGGIKEKDCLRAAAFGICAGILTFLIGVPLFSNGLETMMKDEGIVREKVDAFWSGDIRKSIQSFGKSDRATGGVNDGKLGSYSGLDTDHSVHLKVKTERKPDNIVYLRGFVGDEYTGDSWKKCEERRFDFEQDGLEVENVKANRKYKYHTYPDEEEIPKEWKEGSSYEKTAQRKYRGVPENIRKSFADVAENEIVRMKPENVITEVANLLDHTARYSSNPGKLPEGKDFAEYFFFENQTGYCTHFATTAVLLFRMEEIPARYVGGYVARPEDFIRQEDGTYLAKVTGEEAHAWAEIYVPGTGWIPAETTPGYAGEESESDVVVSEVEEVEEASPDIEPEQVEKPEEYEEQKTDKGNADDKPQQKELEKAKNPVNRHLGIALVFVIGLLLTVAAGLILLGKKRIQERKKKTDYTQRTKETFYRIYQIMLSEKIISKEVDLEEEFTEKICKKNLKISESEANRILDIIYRANYGKDEIKKEEYLFVRRMLLLLEKKK